MFSTNPLTRQTYVPNIYMLEFFFLFYREHELLQ